MTYEPFDFDNWEVRTAMPAWLMERCLADAEGLLVESVELDMELPSWALDHWLHLVRMPQEQDA
jgi:hypothetical protein